MIMDLEYYFSSRSPLKILSRFFHDLLKMQVFKLNKFHMAFCGKMSTRSMAILRADTLQGKPPDTHENAVLYQICFGIRLIRGF